MSERLYAILCKAACYGLAAFTVMVCAILVMAGSETAFAGGVFAGVVTTIIAEKLIVVPPPARRREGKT